MADKSLVYVCTYVSSIAGMLVFDSWGIYGFLKMWQSKLPLQYYSQKNLVVNYIARLVQHSKNPFKTSRDTYKLLPNFLRILYKIFVCWPYSLMARAAAIMLTIPCSVLFSISCNSALCSNFMHYSQKYSQDHCQSN